MRIIIAQMSGAIGFFSGNMFQEGSYHIAALLLLLSVLIGIAAQKGGAA